MEKLNFLQVNKRYYSPPTDSPEFVEVPPITYAMIDGTGDPNTSPDFSAAIQALYGLSYTIKFSRKKAGLGPDYSVAPLEGLWFSDRPADWADQAAPPNWKWTLMIAQPEFVTQADFDQAIKQLQAKKSNLAINHLRLGQINEGQVVQVMYLGSYAYEGPTIAKLHTYAAKHGCSLRGRHHEIYLGDPRRTTPSKLKTIIRQPVRVSQEP